MIRIWGQRERFGATLVAEVRKDHKDCTTWGQEEQANANLIVVAPNLLEALKVVLREIKGTYIGKKFVDKGQTVKLEELVQYNIWKAEEGW